MCWRPPWCRWACRWLPRILCSLAGGFSLLRVEGRWGQCGARSGGSGCRMGRLDPLSCRCGVAMLFGSPSRSSSRCMRWVRGDARWWPSPVVGISGVWLPTWLLCLRLAGHPPWLVYMSPVSTQIATNSIKSHKHIDYVGLFPSLGWIKTDCFSQVLQSTWVVSHIQYARTMEELPWSLTLQYWSYWKPISTSLGKVNARCIVFLDSVN